MSFELLEKSIASGRPQRLYRFVLQHLVLGYTAFESAITLQGRTYQSAPISDDGIRQKGAASSDKLTITAPADFEPARLFLNGRPTINVTIWDKHQDDDEALVIWHGEIEGFARKSAATCDLICRPYGARKMTGLTLSWSRECPYTLYDRNCGLDPENFKHPFIVQSIAGRWVTTQAPSGKPALASLGADYFKAGFVEYQSADGLTLRQGIQSQNGNALLLLGTPYLRHAQAAFAFAGCNQLKSTCAAKFGNAARCGAFPDMPGKSPFDGDPVF